MQFSVLPYNDTKNEAAADSNFIHIALMINLMPFVMMYEQRKQ